ncbi:Ff.00g078580.m01.CDS01 [Fusarium sp. VM40]|nr:Ff.00g078580.m01.CDS01 [Fusarium sp. VM40]
MLFTPLLLLFPAVSLAWPPIVPRQASNSDNCTFTSILPTITLSSIYPTSTVGGHGQVTGGGSLIYTTAFPTLGPDGPGLHTYTITAPCAETKCQPPASGDCPPGFTATTVVCHACGEQAITTILTLPDESATAGQGSAGGDSRKGGSTGVGSAGNQHVVSSAVTLTAFVTSHRTLVVSVQPTESPESPFPWKSSQGPGLPNNPEHSQVPGDLGHVDTKHSRPAGSRESDYPAIHRNPGSLESPVAPTSSATAPQSEPADGPGSVPTGAEAGLKSPSTYPSGQATSVKPTAIVVTGHAPGGKMTGGTIVKVASFAIFLLYTLYV